MEVEAEAGIDGDHEEHDVHPGSPGDHRADERLVAGHVDDAEMGSVFGREFGEAELDGDPARLLFLEPIGISSGQGTDQRGLSVIDMPRRTEDDTSQPRPPRRRGGACYRGNAATSGAC